MTRLILPDWPVDPTMETGMPVFSTVLSRVLADHLHTRVTMHMRTPFARGLVLEMSAAEDDVREAAGLYLDSVGVRWRVTAGVPMLSSAS